MIHDVVLPQLSMGMSEGTITEWAIQEGQRVEKGSVLLSVETEKVMNELPSPHGGFVHIVAQAGATVPVDTVIARVADTEEEYGGLISTDSVAAATVGTNELGARAEASGVSHGKSGRVSASGRARKVAEEHDIDLADIVGSGPAGRIEHGDVLAVIESRRGGQRRVKQRLSLTGMRKTIADRMVEATTAAASVYLFAEMDVTGLLAWRERLVRERGNEEKISMSAICAKALALGLREVPICNATIVEDEIVLWENVNVAIAVSVPGRGEHESGLVTPVLRDVDGKGLLSINQEIKELVARARARTLRVEDLTSGTVNLSSNTGFFPNGWLIGTPLLNLPMVVSFGPGTPIERPVVVDGQVAVRTVLPCNLTFDHRALDGEPAARLLRQIAHHFAHPELITL